MIKYLIMDVDGTLTDGKIYMGPKGEAMKAFSVKDGYVFNYILKPKKILPVILTARVSDIVRIRCEELGIKDIYQGKTEKLSLLKETVLGKDLNSCAYFGDDILDLKCMTVIKKAGGIVGCPADAVAEVKAVADYVCINKAGEGALREFVEWMVKPQDDENQMHNKILAAKEYLYSIDISKVERKRQYVVNDDFFYSIQTYERNNANQNKLQSYRKYVDVQIVIEGSEIVELADISRLTAFKEYDKERDVIMWNEPLRMTSVSLRAGDCMILYPENAYRCKKTEESEKVVKIVGKVKI